MQQRKLPYVAIQQDCYGPVPNRGSFVTEPRSAPSLPERGPAKGLWAGPLGKESRLPQSPIKDVSQDKESTISIVLLNEYTL